MHPRQPAAARNLSGRAWCGWGMYGLAPWVPAAAALPALHAEGGARCGSVPACSAENVAPLMCKQRLPSPYSGGTWHPCRTGRCERQRHVAQAALSRIARGLFFFGALAHLVCARAAGSSLTSPALQPGDKIVEISASFGSEVWKAENYGQVGASGEAWAGGCPAAVAA